jgi:hypothetical protein
MEKKTLIFSLFLMAVAIPFTSFAQCTGGIGGDTLYFTKAPQYISITGYHYYTFHADSGDRYFISSSTIDNPGEITMLDSSGTSILAYNGTYPNGGFALKWKAPYTGTFRALTTLRTCQTDQVGLGTIRYQYTPYRPFPTDNFQWSVRHTMNSPFAQYSVQYKMKGDTIVNGLKYRKIYSGKDLFYHSHNDTLHCFIREENRKVYVKYPLSAGVDTSDMLLYDFNLQEGDTFQVRLLHFDTDSVFDFIVETIFPVSLITDIVSVYQLRPTGPNTTHVWGNACETGFNLKEGIGSGIGLLYNEIPRYSCDNNFPEISCLWDNGVYASGGTYCDYATQVKESAIVMSDIQIIPNPVNERSLIKWPEAEFVLLEITDQKGVMILRKNIQNLRSIYLQKNEMPSGMSFLRLIKPDGTFLSAKILEN